ncbi:MAG: ribosome small subunit-dependent GTPase A [Kofleriaceae bacterium]
MPTSPPPQAPPPGAPAAPAPLAALGFRPHFADALRALGRDDLTAARLIAHFGEQVALAGTTSRFGRLAGRLRHELRADLEAPAVGDWVAVVDGATPDEPAVLHQVLPRQTALVRRAAGRREDAQLVAANVDTFLVVTSANRDANARRVERYVAAVWDSGARPLIVLNKADLCTPAQLDELRDELGRAAPGVPVLAVSAATGEGFDEMMRAATEARADGSQTLALIGMSGVGKSSLVNRLLEAAGAQATQLTLPIDHVDRGRHSTTRRELFFLPDGTAVLDTPGMREFGLVEDEGGLAAGFSDVADLASSCRFADCEHRGEPGCAVRAAIARGELDPDRVAALRKLEREVERAELRNDPASIVHGKRRMKSIHQAQRARRKVDPKLRGG